MKKIIAGLALIVIIGMITSLAACNEIHRIVGSNNIETRDFDYTDFNSVEISHAFTVEIVKSDTYQVQVTLNDNLFDYLDISRSGNTLIIKMNSLSSFIHTTQRVKISMPDLENLDISGASQGTVTGFDAAAALSLEVSGASRLDISGLKTLGSTDIEVSGASRLTGSLVTTGGNFRISGASTLELTGSSTGVKLEVSGASRANLPHFPIVDASATGTGASNATIDVSGSLDIELSGASRLTYSGNPNLGTVDVSGSSTLSHQ